MALQFKLPQMSLTMQEGTIDRWVKAEGDQMKKNETMMEVETDKVTAELTAPCDGRLVKILVPAGETVSVGTVLCVIDDGSEDTAELPTENAQKESTAESEMPAAEPLGKRGKKVASPLAVKIAAKEGISLEGLKGSGPRGVIVKKDVLAAKEQAAAAQTAAVPLVPAAAAVPRVREVPFTGIRKKTAEQMMRSKQMTASLTTFAEVDMTAVREMRKFVHISYTAYAVKAAAMALTEFPYMNASLQGDKILLFEDININVAVSAGDKLVTPVLRGVGEKNLLTVGQELSRLAKRGKEGQLTLQDFEGGTFTVTNSGVFGSLFFTPIINYPQCAILGIGKLMEQPVVRDGQIVIAPMMNLCLTYDHQIVDGSTAVTFLQKVKYYLEHPDEMTR